MRQSLITCTTSQHLHLTIQEKYVVENCLPRRVATTWCRKLRALLHSCFCPDLCVKLLRACLMG